MPTEETKEVSLLDMRKRSLATESCARCAKNLPQQGCTIFKKFDRDHAGPLVVTDTKIDCLEFKEG